MGADFTAKYSGQCYCCYDDRDSEKLEVSLLKYMCVVFCSGTPPGCGLHCRNYLLERAQVPPLPLGCSTYADERDEKFAVTAGTIR